MSVKTKDNSYLNNQKFRQSSIPTILYLLSAVYSKTKVPSKDRHFLFLFMFFEVFFYFCSIDFYTRML